MLKKMNKFFVVVLSAVLAFAGCAAGGSEAQGKQRKAILVTDTGGAHDKSFNQGTNEGLLAYANMHPDQWIAAQAIESKGPQDFSPNLNSAADENDLVIAAGFLMEDDLIAAARRNANRNFVGIDIDLTGAQQIPTNLQTYIFADEQSGYLAGVAAGLQTKTNKIGFLGGEKIPPVQKFGWGFIAGVHAINPEAEISYDYTNTFNDVALGTQKAQAMYNTGADIIFTVAGSTGLGAINEAINQRQAGKDVWVIGVDRDQYAEGIIAGTNTSVVLTSAIKKVGQAAQLALKEIAAGTFQGGRTTNLTIKEDAVGLPETNPNLSAEIAEKIASIEQAVKAGEVRVPQTREAVDGKHVVGSY